MRQIAIGALLALAGSGATLAAEWKAELRLPADKKDRIQGLDLPDGRLLGIEQEENQPAFVQVKGRFERRGWNLLWNDQWLVTGKGGRETFSLVVPIRSETTRLTLTAIDPLGNVETEEIAVQVQDWPKFRDRIPVELRQRGSWGVTVGLARISYRESGVPDYRMSSTRVGATYDYFSPPHWVLRAFLETDVASLDRNPSDMDARFLSAGAQAGYQFGRSPSRATPLLVGGIRYRRMFVSGGDFGYRELLYPEIFPAIRLKLGGLAALIAAKAVPLSYTFSFKDRELSIGARVEKVWSSGTTAFGQLEYSQLRITSGVARGFTQDTGILALGLSL